MQWFRFYSEAIYDRKLSRVAKMSNTSMAEVIGVWAVILCIANDSPQRGELYIADGIPATEEDIADIAGCNVSETLRNMLHVTLLKQDETGTYTVPSWMKRQYESDNSTSRVRKHREQKKNKPEVGKLSDGEGKTETLPKRFSNIPDTDTESDTEEDAPPPAEASPSIDTMQARYSHMMQSVGMTNNYNSQAAKFRAWFESVAMERNRPDFDRAVEAMREDYIADKMGGMSVWQRTAHYLQNGTATADGALFKVYS